VSLDHGRLQSHSFFLLVHYVQHQSMTICIYCQKGQNPLDHKLVARLNSFCHLEYLMLFVGVPTSVICVTILSKVTRDKLGSVMGVQANK
jgi:hypothetical protein